MYGALRSSPCYLGSASAFFSPLRTLDRHNELMRRRVVGLLIAAMSLTRTASAQETGRTDDAETRYRALRERANVAMDMLRLADSTRIGEGTAAAGDIGRARQCV